MTEAHSASPAPTEPAAAPSEFYVPFPSDTRALIEAVRQAMAFAEEVKAANITFVDKDAIDDHMAFLWNALPEVERS